MELCSCKDGTNRIFNRSLALAVSVLVIVLGLSGFFHGFFEALQGNKDTGGFLIEAIGIKERFWESGNEPAFTILHNYLFTGIASMLLSIAIILCALRFLNRKHSAIILFGLFIVLFLFGGGIGQVLFFLQLTAMASRLNKPLKFFKKHSVKTLPLWLILLILCSFSILFALEIAVFGWIPFSDNPDTVTIFMLVLLGTGFILLPFVFILAALNDSYKLKELYL